MFKVFEISNNKRNEIFNEDGLYIVHELGLYELEYSSNPITHYIIFIEDENIDEKHIKKITTTNIVTHSFRFFEDYFGFANVSINDEVFKFNILGEKFELKEIEEIILFLLEKNHTILDNFISKSSIGGASVYKGKEYFYSSKYLNLANNYCEIFELAYSKFQSLPHTVIRKKFKLADYHDQTIGSKSIEWVLENLDIICFDQSYRNDPDSIEIYKNYGLIDKIGSEENELSFATYENEIILGGFKFLQMRLSEIKSSIEIRLKKTSWIQKYDNIQYTDFRDLKIIPFLKLIKDIQILEDRVKKIYFQYSVLFEKARPKNEFPKLTPVFYKNRTYQKAYNAIMLLRNSEYSLEDELQLLNVKKLSELYELYNLHILINQLDEIFNDKSYSKRVDISEDNAHISMISYTHYQKNISVRLYYQAIINHTTKNLNLITIGNSKLIDKHCSPDFILEIILDGKYRYCILDSKYSKINTVKTNHLTSCLKKYLIDVGMKNEPYQKADYLVLLHPDGNDSEENLIYSDFHFPKIRTIVSKPNFTHSLKSIIYQFLQIN